MNTFFAIAASGVIAVASTASAGQAIVSQDSARVERVATQPKERLGTLTCRVAGGVGLIIGSSKKVDCSFKRGSGPSEHYTGSIGKFGLDIGVSGKSYLSWIVYTVKSNRVGHGALAGTYVGASADVALGVGLGANALIGGNSKNFGLQPLSAQSGTGLNVAAGVSNLQLHFTK